MTRSIKSANPLTIKRNTSILYERKKTNVPGKNPLDVVRRKYLGIMQKYTGRNVIAYYSAFIQRNDVRASIDDSDMNAFMQMVYKLDKSKGLDLILHTPGGNLAAAESIVNFLRSIFKDNVRVFIPQIAMSAGTMISLSAKEIIMGKQSNIGPIDPQFGGVSCAGIIEEFESAKKEIRMSPSTIPLWQTIISKYHPTFLGDCEKAIYWSKKIVKRWMLDNMFAKTDGGEKIVDDIVDELSDHKKTYSHARHIHIEECKRLGIKVKALESFESKAIEGCEDLQDCVLTIHHAYMHTFSVTNAVKIIENHLGNAMISTININPVMPRM